MPGGPRSVDDGAVILFPALRRLESPFHRLIQIFVQELPDPADPRFFQSFPKLQRTAADQKGDPSIFQDIGDFPGDQLEIERNDDAPSPDHRQIGGHKAIAVPAHQSHPLSFLQPLRLEERSPAVHLCLQFPIGQLLFLVYQGQPARSLPLQQFIIKHAASLPFL